MVICRFPEGHHHQCEASIAVCHVTIFQSLDLGY